MIFLTYGIPGTHRRYLKAITPDKTPSEENKKTLANLGPEWGLIAVSNDNEGVYLFEAQEPFYGEFKKL